MKGLTGRAEAVDLKRKIEAAQKDARDGVDAAMKDKVHTHEQEHKAKLKSTVNTGLFTALLEEDGWLMLSFRYRKIRLASSQYCQECTGQGSRSRASKSVGNGRADIQAPRSKNIVRSALRGRVTASSTNLQIWSNYDLDLAEKSTKALTAKIALVFICFVNTLPLMVITFLTNLDAVSLFSNDCTDQAGDRKGSYVQESCRLV